MAPVLQQLDAAWPILAASARARHALARWAEEHPILAVQRDLHEVLACRHDPAIAHHVLMVLARLALGDELAARTLLQMLLPGIVKLVGTVGRGDPDAADELVAIAWDRIHTYPETGTARSRPTSSSTSARGT